MWNISTAIDGSALHDTLPSVDQFFQIILWIIFTASTMNVLDYAGYAPFANNSGNQL
ncbi:uncharacterized protein ASCRUDRAFT_76590, partial [Ascoidea rubescens DSM 1968]